MSYPIALSRSFLLPAFILIYFCFSCTGTSSEGSETESFFPLASSSADAYLYRQPQESADGWEIGNIWNENKVEELVNRMHHDTLLGLSGVLISHQGTLLLEEYKNDWPSDSLMQLQDNDMLLIATLTGVVQKAQIGLMERLVKIPSGNYATKKRFKADTAVDLQHLLKMETGLLCRPQQQVLQTTPGQGKAKRFYYCPANYQAIAQWLEVQTDEPLSYFAEENLFEPLEIDHYTWDDLEVRLRARDMLKFSALHAQKGSWMQQQLLADDWVFQLQSHAYDPDSQGQFAWGWWQQVLRVDGRQFAVFYSKGRNYLLMFVPDLDAGVLFTGNLKKPAADYFPLLQRYALPALQEK